MKYQTSMLEPNAMSWRHNDNHMCRIPLQQQFWPYRGHPLNMLLKKEVIDGRILSVGTLHVRVYSTTDDVRICHGVSFQHRHLSKHTSPLVF